jgi:site-specific DNA-cytosine methylase
MLDLYSGLGGASAVMRERGWFVVTVELEPSLRPDVVADVRYLPIRGQWDLIWASPPCTEFSRESMPWCRTGSAPDLSLVLAAKAAIAELRPRWWVIENVRGAQPWLGPARWIRNPVYLWGQFPSFDCRVEFWKEKLSSKRRQERAKMPRALSEALAIACESTFRFEETA